MRCCAGSVLEHIQARKLGLRSRRLYGSHPATSTSPYTCVHIRSISADKKNLGHGMGIDDVFEVWKVNLE